MKPEWHFSSCAIFGGGLVIFRGRSNISWSCRVTFRGRWLHRFYVGDLFFPFRPARPGTTYSMESRFHSYTTSKDTSDEGRATATRQNRQDACHSQGVSTGALVLMQIDVFSIFFKANLFLFDASALFGTWECFQKIGRKICFSNFHLGWSFRSSEWLIQLWLLCVVRLEICRVSNVCYSTQPWLQRLNQPLHWYENLVT